MRPRARHLRHNADPVRFADAILRCEGYAPECSAEERCLAGGECFGHAPHLVAARMIERLLPAHGGGGVHYAYLRKVAQQLRDGDVVL